MEHTYSTGDEVLIKGAIESVIRGGDEPPIFKVKVNTSCELGGFDVSVFVTEETIAGRAEG